MTKPKRKASDVPKEEVPDEVVFTEGRSDRAVGWMAKPLSLSGTARIIKLFTGVLDDAAQRMAVMAKLLAAKEGETEGYGPSPLVTIVEVLGDEAKLQELFSIVTGQSPSWVRKNWSLAGATKALKEFLEVEDAGAILGNLGEGRDLLVSALSAPGIESDGSQGPSTG